MLRELSYETGAEIRRKLPRFGMHVPMLKHYLVREMRQCSDRSDGKKKLIVRSDKSHTVQAATCISWAAAYERSIMS